MFPFFSYYRPDKLLYDSGEFGKTPGNFSFPRGLAINEKGDIYVADTKNNRVQCFNSAGLLKFVFGEKGSQSGQLLNPTGITVLPNNHVLVADTKNCRIQAYRSDGSYCYSFETTDQPYGIASDESYNIAVSTGKQTVEVYRKRGQFLSRFSHSESEDKNAPYSYLTINDKEEIIVADRTTSDVKYYTIDGRLLYKFKLQTNMDGLAFKPISICVNIINQLIITDGLNHTVNLFSERGILLHQLLGPIDDAGALHACAVGPEGHLITTEFSVTGRHCMKIFRYRNCECHRTRPGSSRRSTPSPM